MSRDIDDAMRALRMEVQRLSGHRTDRVFLTQRLDILQDWLREIERQHQEREAKNA